MIESIVTLCVRHFGTVSALSLLALILGCWSASNSPLDVFSGLRAFASRRPDRGSRACSQTSRGTGHQDKSKMP